MSCTRSKILGSLGRWPSLPLSSARCSPSGSACHLHRQEQQRCQGIAMSSAHHVNCVEREILPGVQQAVGETAEEDAVPTQ